MVKLDAGGGGGTPSWMRGFGDMAGANSAAPTAPGLSIGSAASRVGASVAAAARGALTPTRPSSPPPARQPVNIQPRVGSSFGGGGGGGISGMGTGATGSLAPVTPPPPAPPSVDQWLASDSTYQGQLSGLNKAVADYLAQSNAQKSQYGAQYDTNTRDLGLARTEGTTALRDDYASRGLMTSGLYGKAFSDLQTDYDKKQQALDTAKANFLAQLLQGQQNFQSDTDIKRTTAKQSAIDRRAAQYNL